MILILPMGVHKVNILGPFLSEAYCANIDMTRLRLHSQILPDVIRQYSLETHVMVKKVTSIRTICDALSYSQFQIFLSEVDVVLKQFLTAPVTTATAERGFSALGRVKTYLLSTMT